MSSILIYVISDFDTAVNNKKENMYNITKYLNVLEQCFSFLPHPKEKGEPVFKHILTEQQKKENGVIK